MHVRVSLLSVLLLLSSFLVSQQIYESEKYVPETDPLVLENIKEWQGFKFGLLMHWGAYSQWGIVESWSLCPEEYGWCERKMGSNPDDYNTYKKEYENLILTFNPVDFNPERWAKAAKAAGMKYVVFTTKHHDGFCMFDTKYTDYKITSEECPFASNPKRDVTKEIFNAFRDEGLWAGAYFSKPDWHMPYYWDPKYPPRDRNVNYDPHENPETWQKYVDFTHNQMLELLTNYGDVKIMWLDGGWVAKKSKDNIEQWYIEKLEDSEDGYLKNRRINQDINMDDFVVKAREKQPGLIVVDRAVYGKNQNYLTPENRVPDTTLPYPWESCVISGGGWAHTKDAKYMSGREGIQLLVDIVTKGGNLLLNIAPTPEGEWQQGAYDLLEDYADWMKINSSAIYETIPLYPYKMGNICMTQKKTGEKYFYYLCDEGESTMPDEIVIPNFKMDNDQEIRLLGYHASLKWKEKENNIIVKIPGKLQNNPPCESVWVLEVNRK